MPQSIEINHTAAALHYKTGGGFWENEALLLRNRVVELETILGSTEALEARLAELRAESDQGDPAPPE